MTNQIEVQFSLLRINFHLKDLGQERARYSGKFESALSLVAACRLLMKRTCRIGSMLLDCQKLMPLVSSFQAATAWMVATCSCKLQFTSFYKFLLEVTWKFVSSIKALSLFHRSTYVLLYSLLDVHLPLITYTRTTNTAGLSPVNSLSKPIYAVHIGFQISISFYRNDIVGLGS